MRIGDGSIDTAITVLGAFKCSINKTGQINVREENEKEINGYIDMAIDALKKQPKIGGWIPCSERLPETSEYMEFEPTPYMKRIEIAYMTDTVEYLIGFYDGSKWMDKHHNIIKNVITWKPFLKLPEAYHG